MSSIATCGKLSLHIIDADTGDIEWSLIWADNTSIPADEKSWLAWYNSGTDDIKAINDNQQFLISSVCGLLAIVDRATCNVEIIGWAPGAHSIEAMPGTFIAAAISSHPSYPPGAPEITGNKFQLYDSSRPCEILWEYEAEQAPN